MHDGTSQETLTILVVTEDRMLQGQLAQFFALVGYPCLQAADRQSALAAMAAAAPQIVLIDADQAAAADWELCRQLSQRACGTTPFKILLVDEPDESHLAEALEAGIDDFLAKPISHGELLARIRTAVRVLEYDRRVAQQARIDSLTGLISRSAFTAHLRRQLSDQRGATPRVACVVLDIDFFARVERTGGEPATAATLQAFARELNALRSGSEVLGRLGGDRFCVMLAGADEDEARDWADTARKTLDAVVYKLGDTPLKLPASFGVAGCQPNESAADLIERATQALATAKNLGRNCVVAWSQWQASAVDEADEPFGQTVARDVMVPCTVYLRPGESVAEALDLLEQTRLEGIPVVDDKGKLQGMVLPENCADVAEEDLATWLVRDVMTTDVRAFDAGENLAGLMDHFHGDAGSLALVLADGRPIGFVTCDSLVVLSRPVDAGSVAPEGEYGDTSDYLLVPDVRPLVADEAE